jgi:hypothetical protein
VRRTAPDLRLRGRGRRARRVRAVPARHARLELRPGRPSLHDPDARARDPPDRVPPQQALPAVPRARHVRGRRAVERGADAR